MQGPGGLRSTGQHQRRLVRGVQRDLDGDARSRRRLRHRQGVPDGGGREARAPRRSREGDADSRCGGHGHEGHPEQRRGMGQGQPGQHAPPRQRRGDIRGRQVQAVQRSGGVLQLRRHQVGGAAQGGPGMVGLPGLYVLQHSAEEQPQPGGDLPRRVSDLRRKRLR